jgi:hypothetical protein
MGPEQTEINSLNFESKLKLTNNNLKNKNYEATFLFPYVLAVYGNNSKFITGAEEYN